MRNRKAAFNRSYKVKKMKILRLQNKRTRLFTIAVKRKMFEKSPRIKKRLKMITTDFDGKIVKEIIMK